MSKYKLQYMPEYKPDPDIMGTAIREVLERNGRMYKPAGQRYSREYTYMVFSRGFDQGFNSGLDMAVAADDSRAEDESLADAIVRTLSALNMATEPKPEE